MLSRIMDLNVLTHGYANPQTPQNQNRFTLQPHSKRSPYRAERTLTRHPEFTIESPHLDKFLLQPKATARQPQISSLSTSLDCIFFFQANTIHNFSFSCKANTNQSFFSCESNPVHTTSFLLLSFKADLLSFKPQKAKAKSKQKFHFLSKQFQKQFKKQFF